MLAHISKKLENAGYQLDYTGTCWCISGFAYCMSEKVAGRLSPSLVRDQLCICNSVYNCAVETLARPKVCG